MITYIVWLLRLLPSKHMLSWRHVLKAFKEVILSWSCEKPTCTFTRKNSFTQPHSCILPSFSHNSSRLFLPKRLWKCVSKLFFMKYKQKAVLLVIYCSTTIHLSQLFSYWIWHLTFSWESFLSNKLEFFFSSCNIKGPHR